MDSTLSDETMEQMAVRIGLKCTEKDSTALLGFENDGIRNLGNDMGMAVYNNENGRGENSIFKIAYCDEVEKSNILSDVEDKFKNEYKEYKCKILTGNSAVDIEKDADSIFNNNLLINKSKNNHSIWLGEPIKIGQPVSISFERGQNNLIIISNDEEQLNTMLFYIVMSIIYEIKLQNKNYNDSAISLVDFSYDLCEISPEFNKLINLNRKLIQTLEDCSEKSIITNMYNEFIRRRDENDFNAESKYLIINGIHKLGRVFDKPTRSSLSFSFDEDETEEISTNEMFESLVRDGGEFGIFVIATSDTYRNYNRFIEKISYEFKDYINMRIAFRMNEDDGRRFIDDELVDNLNETTAILYDDISGVKTKFKIYKIPSEKWLEEKFI